MTCWGVLYKDINGRYVYKWFLKELPVSYEHDRILSKLDIGASPELDLVQQLAIPVPQ